jgi:hypothetical protein
MLQQPIRLPGESTGQVLALRFWAAGDFIFGRLPDGAGGVLRLHQRARSGPAQCASDQTDGAADQHTHWASHCGTNGCTGSRTGYQATAHQC